MSSSIKPNKVYLIISSAVGPKGDAVGRKCKTLSIVNDRPPHTLWGDIWVVTSVDAPPFLNDKGGASMNVMVPEDWLQDIPGDPDKEQDRLTELDLAG